MEEGADIDAVSAEKHPATVRGQQASWVASCASHAGAASWSLWGRGHRVSHREGSGSGLGAAYLPLCLLHPLTQGACGGHLRTLGPRRGNESGSPGAGTVAAVSSVEETVKAQGQLGAFHPVKSNLICVSQEAKPGAQLGPVPQMDAISAGVPEVGIRKLWESLLLEPRGVGGNG